MQAFLDVVVEFVSAEPVAAEEPLEPRGGRQVGRQRQFGDRRFFDYRKDRLQIGDQRGELRQVSEGPVEIGKQAFGIALLDDAGVFFLRPGHGFTPEPARVPIEDHLQIRDPVFGQVDLDEPGRHSVHPITPRADQ